MGEWIAQKDADSVNIFFFVCFFCNNQYRILVDKSANGSDDLEKTFEMRLTRIGRVVAFLDTWNHSVYLTRIWTIYEQFVSIENGIEVEMVLPPSESARLIQEFKVQGGFDRVVQALRKVDAERAVASCKQDEVKVKEMIRQSVGMHAVNEAVLRGMMNWCVSQFQVRLAIEVRAQRSDPDSHPDA